MSVPISPVSADEAVAYFRAHGLQKTERRVGRKIWEPLLLEMIEDYYSLDEITAWISEHHPSLGYKKPADITVRDWISQIRKERDMPLRRRGQASGPSIEKGQVKPETTPVTSTPSGSELRTISVDHGSTLSASSSSVTPSRVSFDFLKGPEVENFPSAEEFKSLNETKFAKRISPIFAKREVFLNDAMIAAKALTSTDHQDFYLNLIAALPKDEFSVFTTMYADLYVIFRCDYVSLDGWKLGIGAGKRKFLQP